VNRRETKKSTGLRPQSGFCYIAIQFVGTRLWAGGLPPAWHFVFAAMQYG
jgi:hypothetical protein